MRYWAFICLALTSSGETIHYQTLSSGVIERRICVLDGKLDSLIIVGGHFDLAESGSGVVRWIY